MLPTCARTLFSHARAVVDLRALHTQAHTVSLMTCHVQVRPTEHYYLEAGDVNTAAYASGALAALKAAEAYFTGLLERGRRAFQGIIPVDAPAARTEGVGMPEGADEETEGFSDGDSTESESAGSGDSSSSGESDDEAML